MKLIVGLGNPGREYEGTRHNAGFWLLDSLRADIAESQLFLFKPQRFMNESGEEVARQVRFLNLDPDALLLLHDDFDLPLGEWRLHFNRGGAGHKGVESVIESLGSQAFWRLRVGTGRPGAGVAADEYVLSCFSTEEQKVLAGLYPLILSSVEKWVSRK